MSSIYLDSKNSSRQLKEKHVTFAPNPIYLKSIPWKINNMYEDKLSYEQSLDPNETDSSKNFMQFTNFEGDYNYKSFKVPYHLNKDTPDIIGLVIIIICLISLFMLIWWIADKLLLLEIEKQVSKTPLRSTNSHINMNSFQR